MERHFDEELKSLNERILYMGGLIESMTYNAIKALVDRNADLVKEIFKTEDEVNKLHIEIDDKCLKLVALRQPTAVDLRFIAFAMKINSDLERMGDQAVNIAENTEDLLKQPQLKPLIDLPKMADIAKIW